MIPNLSFWLGSLFLSGPIYLVGGTVRDLFLGRDGKDLDIAVGRARELAETIRIQKNAVLIPLDKDPRVPCFRLVERNNPQNTLDVAQLFDCQIQSDLSRRDFSINAMALEAGRVLAGSGEVRDLLPHVLDPCGGLKDLENRRVRALGKPNFLDDPLRMMRAFRMAGSLDMEIEPQTLSWIGELAHSIQKVSSERISQELFALLDLPRSRDLVVAMDKTGLLEAVLPAIGPMKGCEQDAFHHADVWGHTLEMYLGLEYILNNLEKELGVAADFARDYVEAPNRRAVIKLAALLHDVGKPRTRGLHPKNGRITFWGHDREGARDAMEIGRFLRLSNEDCRLLSLLVAQHQRPRKLLAPQVKEKTRTAWFRKLGDDAVGALLLAMADSRAKKGPQATDVDEINRQLKNAARDYLSRIRPRMRSQRLVGGRDLMGLGVSPGPEMGRLLKALSLAQDAGTIKSQDQALEMARKLIREKRAPS